jgi:hypothetical protein
MSINTSHIPYLSELSCFSEITSGMEMRLRWFRTLGTGGRVDPLGNILGGLFGMGKGKERCFV